MYQTLHGCSAGANLRRKYAIVACAMRRATHGNARLSVHKLLTVANPSFVFPLTM